MREYTPDPRLYEMMTILSPDVPEDDLPAQIEAIAGYITTAGGTVNETLRESPWGRRRLAYSIRHAGRDIRDGFYTVFHFTLDPGGVRDIERDLKLNDLVMRFLITHYTPKPEIPGAATEGGEQGSAESEAPVATADAAVADGGEPVETAAATEPVSEAADTPAPEAAASEAAAPEVGAAEAEAPEAAAPPESEAVEAVAEEAAPAETSDTEAASASTEAVEDSPAAEASAEEPATDVPASEETPAEPTAPAKDDEEA